MNGKNGRSADQIVVYCFARCEQFIEDYARGHNLLSSELTQRVGELLCAQAGGEVLGGMDNLSNLSSQGSGRTHRKSEAGTEVALAGSTHSNTQNSEKVRHHNINAKEALWLREKVSKMRSAGASWEEISVETGRSERAIKRAVDYRPPRSYNGTHWMQKPENQGRVHREMNKRRKKMLEIAAKAGIDGKQKLPRAEWWRRYRQARDKMVRKGD